MSGSARDYVLKLALPDAGPSFETAKAFEFSDKQEAVAVAPSSQSSRMRYRLRFVAPSRTTSSSRKRGGR
jgi:hypothetical protein